MPPLVLTLLQGLFLVLLYLFVARAVRAVLRDLSAAQPERAPARAPTPRRPAPRRPTAPPARRERRPRGRPAELVVHGPQGRPRVVQLDSGDVTFGRSEAATVMLVDAYVSDRHARVFQEGDDWLVADLGSTNGTYLNQVKVTAPTPIAAGDQLAMGKTTVEVRR
ncbi:MAG TPA: FHA domain-containing protein [Egibacteraceae bacterium]|nr:FHA domain-containing protein [Egibacteraceae bacterium]